MSAFDSHNYNTPRLCAAQTHAVSVFIIYYVGIPRANVISTLTLTLTHIIHNNNYNPHTQTRTHHTPTHARNMRWIYGSYILRYFTHLRCCAYKKCMCARPGFACIYCIQNHSCSYYEIRVTSSSYLRRVGTHHHGLCTVYI